MSTPAKTPRRRQSTVIDSENSDPNIQFSSPQSSSLKQSKTPVSKSSAVKSKINAYSTPKSPPPPPLSLGNAAPVVPRERRFIVAKKKNSKGVDCNKSREVAYEALRRSQDEFFRKPNADNQVLIPGELLGSVEVQKNDSLVKKELGKIDEESNEVKNLVLEEAIQKEENRLQQQKQQDFVSSAETKKLKSLVMEEALNCLPEPGSGRVKHLVQAFESLLSLSKEHDDGTMVEDSKRKVFNWALPGLQQLPSKMAGVETESSVSVPVFSSVEFVPSKEFHRDSRLCSSLDSCGDRLSWGSRTTGGGRRSRRNSTDSTGRSWNKKLKVTSQKPFKLRTEQRGRVKEEQFCRKVQEMIIEEEKKRIPIAQGLPWTTDEPECLVKPHIKDPTEPLDIILHSDVRAVERAEFDHYVTERISLAEHLKQERERLRKLEEEEEIRRLRRELVPKAQPMPYFDRPFVPKKSSKPRTVPKEPRFHARQQKEWLMPLPGLWQKRSFAEGECRSKMLEVPF